MELKKKSNQIRTLLLLKTASEVKNYILSPTKINSISPKNLYKLYNNIEISIKKRIFSTTERRNSQICKDKKSPIINTINESSPINEPFYKLNKFLISFKKNKKFYETNDFYDNKYNNIISQESTDTSNSLNEKKIIINNENVENKNEFNSIKYLRKIAKSFIQRKIKKKKNTHLKTLYGNKIYNSQYKLNSLERKFKNNLTVNYSQNNENIIIKNCFTNININSNLNMNKISNDQESIINNPLIKGNNNILINENNDINQYYLFCPSPSKHKGISFYKNNNFLSSCNLKCKNHISKINNENNNLRRSAFMCIPYKDIVQPDIYSNNNNYTNNENVIIVNQK